MCFSTRSLKPILPPSGGVLGIRSCCRRSRARRLRGLRSRCNIPDGSRPTSPSGSCPSCWRRTRARQNWRETVVSDTTLHADYVSMAPGTKTPRMFHPDNRAWWIVQDGQIRFNIEGQEPFVASKGFLVQVPYRNVFSLEVVGDKPSLFVEVNIGGDKTAVSGG